VVAAVDLAGGVVADAGVAVVVVVVVGEERVDEGPCVGEAGEAFGEPWCVLRVFELGFGERVVVGHVGPGVGAGAAQVGEELGRLVSVRRRRR
jgi:hypothetical protein